MNKPTSSTPSAMEDKKEPIADQAKHAVSNVAGQVKEQVTHQLDTRKDQAIDKVGSVADAIRDTSDKLKDIAPLGDIAGRAADGIQSVATFFEDKKITDVVRDVERFARREPALFLGAALAIGLVGGRFLKSSSHRDQTPRGGQGYDEFLPDDDLEDYVESNRGGAASYGRSSYSASSYGSSTAGSAGSTTYGMAGTSQRSTDPLRTTLPLGTPAPAGRQGPSNPNGTGRM